MKCVCSEGYVREIISKVQTMRRDSKFEVTDRIKIFAQGNSKLLDVFTRSTASASALASRKFEEALT